MASNFFLVPGLVVLLAGIVSGACLYRMRMPLRRPQGKTRRTLECIILSLIMLVALGAAGGASFNALAIHHLRALYPAPGKLYTVNGYKMHLYCTGQGSPTILLEAGLGNDSLSWTKVQPDLSKTTRVCSYDRAGYGWSDPRPGSRDADQIADQLHLLLDQAGMTGPVVLMGHSMGGLFIRAYATRYPQHVAGLIFVDSTTPLQQDHGWVELSTSSRKSKLPPLLADWIDFFGLPRILGRCAYVPPGFESRAGWIRADQCTASQVRETAREFKDFRLSGNETLHTGPFADLLILIVSRDPNVAPAPGLPPNLVREQAVIWNEMQEELKRLSPRSRRIIAQGSGHSVPLDRADLLNREVPLFIEQLGGHQPPPDYGSTTTE